MLTPRTPSLLSSLLLFTSLGACGDDGRAPLETDAGFDMQVPDAGTDMATEPERLL